MSAEIMEDFKPNADGGGEVEIEAEEELQIEVVDDRPEEDKVPPRDEARLEKEDNDFDSEEHDAELDALGDKATKRIKRLRYEYHEERRAKEAAERMREEAIRFAEQTRMENEKMRQVLEQGEKVLFTEMQSRAKANLERARQEYKVALDSDNTDAVLAAQENLSRAQIEAHQAEGYQTQFPVDSEPVSEAGKLAPPAQGQVPPAQQDPKLTQWLAANPWFQTDAEMHHAAMTIHREIVEKDGILPTTDEYYKRIDTRMRENFPTKFGIPPDGGGEVEPAASPEPTVVAPASRTTQPGKSRRVQLTATQVDLANRLGLTPQQYAKQLLIEEAKRNG